MKKPILLFVAVFAILMVIFTGIEKDKINLNAAIEKSPGYSLVTADGITKKTKKGHSTFQVNYVYQVGANEYKFNTDFMEETAAMTMAARSDVQVAYATNQPDKAILKSDFDGRDRDASLMGALAKAAGVALLAGLIITAVLAYKFPWFRR